MARKQSPTLLRGSRCSGTEKWSQEKQCNENLFLPISLVRKGTKIAVSFFAETEQWKRSFQGL